MKTPEEGSEQEEKAAKKAAKMFKYSTMLDSWFAATSTDPVEPDDETKGLPGYKEQENHLAFVHWHRLRVEAALMDAASIAQIRRNWTSEEEFVLMARDVYANLQLKVAHDVGVDLRVWGEEQRAKAEPNLAAKEEEKKEP